VPLIPFFIVIAIVLVVFLPKLTSQSLVSTGEQSGQNASARSAPIEWSESIQTGLRIALCIAILLHLAWISWFSGGIIGNPFAQFITLCAVLAPYLSNQPRMGVALGIATIVVYAGEQVLYNWQSGQPWNQYAAVVLTIPVLAASISLVMRYFDDITRRIREGLLRRNKWTEQQNESAIRSEPENSKKSDAIRRSPDSPDD
jgi:uncharacterized membrane protein